MSDRIKPTQLHRTPAAELSDPQRWKRSVAMIDASGLVSAVDRVLNAVTGRPRICTGRAFLVSMSMHGVTGGQMVLTTAAAKTVAKFTPSQLRELGLSAPPTYNMLWDAFRKITAALEAGTVTDDDGTTVTADQFAVRIIAASIPDTYTLTESAAIDGTDFETWSRRRSWGNKDSLSTAGTQIPDGTLIKPTKKHVPEAGFPIVGLDGLLQNTKDPDARDGYRSGHDARQSDVYAGYELHLATQIRTIGGSEVPHLLTGVMVTPAGSHRGTAAVRTIEGMTAVGHVINDLCADRGYTPVRPDRFILPMWSRGITVWGDLTENQRTQHPGPIPGTVWVDGGLYISALPDIMRDLHRPGINTRTEDRRRIANAFDQRKPFQFMPLTKRDADGYQRFKGPAVAGHVRCPNTPKTMRLPYSVPTTACVKGEPCACGKTVTITPDMYPRERQDAAWGSTDWVTAYYRRVGIESFNAELKTHRLDLRRGFTRVFGRVKNAFLLAFAFAGVNVRILAAWHAKRRLSDPWGVALGEPAPTPPTAPKTRTRRRTRTYTDLAPPDPGDPDQPDIEVAS